MIKLIKDPKDKKEKLFADFQHLVLWIAKKNARKGFSADDLFQVGAMTLLRCIELKPDNLTSGYVSAATRRAMLETMRAECNEPSEYADDTIEQTVANPDEDGPDPGGRDNSDELIAITDMEKLFAKCLSPFEDGVMRMRWIMGHSSKELAALQSVSVDTINRAEGCAIKKLSRTTEFPTLDKGLWRLILLQAVINGDTPPDHLHEMCQAAEANFDTVSQMTPETAQKNLTLLRRAGLK